MQHLAQLNQDLLLWHLKQHEGALILCVQTIAEHPFTAPIIGENDDMYTSEDDYFSEDEDALEAIVSADFTQLWARLRCINCEDFAPIVCSQNFLPSV